MDEITHHYITFFDNHNLDKLETEVNEFLDNQQQMFTFFKIHNVRYSSVLKHELIHFSVCIHYEYGEGY